MKLKSELEKKKVWIKKPKIPEIQIENNREGQWNQNHALGALAW